MFGVFSPIAIPSIVMIVAIVYPALLLTKVVSVFVQKEGRGDNSVDGKTWAGNIDTIS